MPWSISLIKLSAAHDTDKSNKYDFGGFSKATIKLNNSNPKKEIWLQQRSIIKVALSSHGTVIVWMAFNLQPFQGLRPAKNELKCLANADLDKLFQNFILVGLVVKQLALQAEGPRFGEQS